MPAKLPPGEAERRKKIRDREYRLKNIERYKATNKVWRENNSESIKARRKIWMEKNKDRMLQYARDYYNNRMPIEKKIKKWEKLKEWTAAHPNYQSEWVSRNLKRLAAKRAKRRCLLNERVHPDANLSEIAKIYQQCAIVSVQTGTRHEVDHIIPIIHGGYHHEYNLQILPESVNRSKADKIDWAMDGFKSWRDVPAYLWPKLLYEQNKNT